MTIDKRYARQPAAAAMLKILLDRSIALLALLLLALPVMLPVWLLIRATSKGGAVYAQERVGLGCRTFRLYKFRSMVVGADKAGFQTQSGDARITPVGRFIRTTSIDELPQLFNVLNGDMSLVGPRPDTPIQRNNYTQADWELRHSVRPGITGLAQVNGRSNIGTQERLAYDLNYARHHTLRMDIAILFKTLRVAVGKGTN